MTHPARTIRGARRDAPDRGGSRWRWWWRWPSPAPARTRPAARLRRRGARRRPASPARSCRRPTRAAPAVRVRRRRPGRATRCSRSPRSARGDAEIAKAVADLSEAVANEDLVRMRAGAIGLENLIDGLSKQFVGLAGLSADGRSAGRVPGRVRPDRTTGRPPSSRPSTPATPTAIVARDPADHHRDDRVRRAPPGAVRLGRPSCRTSRTSPLQLGRGLPPSRSAAGAGGPAEVARRRGARRPRRGAAARRSRRSPGRRAPPGAGSAGGSGSRSAG